MRRASKRPVPRRFIAILADVIGARDLGAPRRRQVQRNLMDVLARLNHQHKAALQAKFKITSGGAFEALLFTGEASASIPDLIWSLETEFEEPALRIGMGLGSVDTDLSEDASTLDGPAFHHARTAVTLAARNKQLGGVFYGFGDPHDAILNGIARLLRYQRSRWSEQQRNVAVHLRTGKLQTETARLLKLTKQAVSAYARAAGWEAYAEGEAAWRAAIRESLREPARGASPSAASWNSSSPATPPPR